MRQKKEKSYCILLIKNESIAVVISIKDKIGKLLKLLKEEIIVYGIGWRRQAGINSIDFTNRIQWIILPVFSVLTSVICSIAEKNNYRNIQCNFNFDTLEQGFSKDSPNKNEEHDSVPDQHYTKFELLLLVIWGNAWEVRAKGTTIKGESMQEIPAAVSSSCEM